MHNRGVLNHHGFYLGGRKNETPDCSRRVGDNFCGFDCGIGSVSGSGASPATARGEIIGFGGNGVGWTLNGAQLPDVLTLTDNNPAEASSVFYNTQVPVTTAFTTTFTYTAGGIKGGNGAAFVLENDPRGTNAIGGDGSGLGYGTALFSSNGPGIPITPSLALEFNIYTEFPGYTPGTQYGTGGTTGGYSPTTPVNLASGDPILFSLNYDGSQYLTETLTDLTTSNTWSTTYNVGSLAATTGGTSAYLALPPQLAPRFPPKRLRASLFPAAPFPNRPPSRCLVLHYWDLG